MGPNRRAQERERAAAKAAEAAKRAEAERKAAAEAQKIVEIWNARQAGGRALWFYPTIGAAIAAKYPWLTFSCPGCRVVGSVDLRRLDRHPGAAISGRAMMIRHGRNLMLGTSRRVFIAGLGSATAWPVVAGGQPSDKPVIGFLSARSAKESAHLVEAFRKGLAEQGVIEGQNAIVDYSWADTHYERLGGQAADLVTRRLAVLVCVGGDMTAKAAVAATRSTPIVAVFLGDPVAEGFVASLSRPGGNVTGVSNLNAVIESKRLGLLREIKPGIALVGALLNPGSPTVVSSKRI